MSDQSVVLQTTRLLITRLQIPLAYHLYCPFGFSFWLHKMSDSPRLDSPRLDSPPLDPSRLVLRQVLKPKKSPSTSTAKAAAATGSTVTASFPPDRPSTSLSKANVPSNPTSSTRTSSKAGPSSPTSSDPTPVTFRYSGETYTRRKKHAAYHLYYYGNPYVGFLFVHVLVMRGLQFDMICVERNGKELFEQLGKFVSSRDNVAITFNSKEILLLFRHASDAEMILALHPGGPYRNFAHIFDNATYVTATRPGYRHQHGIEFTYADPCSPDDDDRQSRRLATILCACRRYGMVSRIDSSCTDPPMIHQALCKVWFHSAEAQRLALDRMPHDCRGTSWPPITAIVDPLDYRQIAAVPSTIVSASLIGGPQIVARPPPAPATWSTFDYLFVNGTPAIVAWAKDLLKPEHKILSVDVEVESDEGVDQVGVKRRRKTGDEKGKKAEKVTEGTRKSRKSSKSGAGAGVASVRAGARL